MRACTVCSPYLPLGPRPVFQLCPDAKVLIAGQAPGSRVHATGIPFNDPSGDRLRRWLGVDRDAFYNPKNFAILPMGFCFPGTGKSGDLPPRPECAPTWRKPLLAGLTQLKLTLVIGAYAIDWHLGNRQKASLTETVQNWREFWPEILVMPHPSPRNQIWLMKNPWFENEVIPHLQKRVKGLLAAAAKN